jgi:hypothetical protein
MIHKKIFGFPLPGGETNQFPKTVKYAILFRMKKDHKIKYLKYSVQDIIGDAVPGKFLFVALLRKDWARIVGEGIAHHSLPAHVRNDCLTVNVDDPIWIQELTLQKDSIRENILDYFRNPDFEKLFHSLKFRTGDIAVNVPEPERSDEKLLLDKETLLKIDQSVSGIEDKDLRLALRKYFIASSLKPVKKPSPGQKREFDNL